MTEAKGQLIEHQRIVAEPSAVQCAPEGIALAMREQIKEPDCLCRMGEVSAKCCNSSQCAPEGVELALRERIKELNCLYQLSEIVENCGNSLDALFQGAVDILPDSWLYPEIACARIAFGGSEYATPNFKDSSWKLSADILVAGGKAGVVEVLYLQEKPTLDEGPFLREERSLINAVAERLGKSIERIQAQERIKQQQYYLEKAQELGRIGTWELDLRQNKLYWTDENYRIFGVPAGSVVNYEIFIEKVHPDDRKHVDREWSAALDGKPYDIEHRVVVDDATIWVRGKAEVEFDEEGTAIRAIGFTQDITDHKQATQALRESEEHFRDFFDNVAIGNHSFGPDQIIIDINNAELEMIGYKKDEIVGKKTWMDLIIPEQKSQFERHWQDMLTKGGAQELEYTLVHKDGHHIDVLLNASSRFDENGNLICTRGTALNIMVRKQAEQALRQSEERFRTSILESPFPIMIHAEDGEVLQINKVWTELTGYEPDEIPTLAAWTRLAYGKRKDIVKSRIDEIFDCDTRIEEGEYIISSKEGKLLTWDFSSAPLGKMPDGRRLVISMAMNITKRKQAEESLRQVNQQLQISIDQMPTAYILWDRAFRVLEWNNAAEKIFGYTRDDALGCKLYELIVPKSIHYLVREVLEKLQNGEPVSYSDTNNNIRKDGTVISCQWHNKPLVDDNGKIFAILSLAEDITARLQAEEKEKQHQAELAHADRLSIMGQMASELAHELSQPLCAIMGHAESSLRAAKSSEATNGDLADQIETIVKQTDRAAKIVARIKRFSAKKTRARSVVYVNEAVGEVLDIVDYEIKRYGIKIDLDLNDTKPIQADPVQIEQVILNLIQNGIEALQETTQPQRTLTISTRNLDGAIEVAVRNSGHGINEEVVEKIFDSFFTTKTQGLGIGLSISRSIIESHGGNLNIRDNSANGVTFYFTLPTDSKNICD